MTIRTTYIKQEILPVDHDSFFRHGLFVPNTRIATIVERIPTINTITHRRLTVDDYRVASVRYSGGVYIVPSMIWFQHFYVHTRMMGTAHEQLIKYIEL